MDSWPYRGHKKLRKEEDSMKVKCVIGLGIVACAGLASAAANAGGVSFGINLGVPAPVYAAPVYAAPVYAPPPPPVYAPPPPPVVYQPAPVVVAPAPAIVVGWHGGRYWDGYRYWNRGDYYARHGGYGYHRW
jgi:hypothetical protein